MSDVIRGLVGFIFRVALMLAGLLFVVSLLLAALVVFAVWSLRAFWARLTGKPVQPWTFQVNRQAMWDRFYRAQGQGGSPRPPGQGPTPRREDPDIIDVEPKEIKRSED